ncbi:pseudouridine synthase [Dipodascopsis tothii]|uniref:pseudouridine synthase n=1 Tax=Dipodascopsis tothii TaxID=44089 RepID=UPI0034CF49EC
MLNNLLPDDIKAYEVCLHPPADFDARFSCRSRHYKYFFVANSSQTYSPDGVRARTLDVAAMQDAAARLVGTHDFRNYCKLDGSKQLVNFERTILDAAITPVNDVAGVDGADTVYVFDLKGYGFLWHQVRCTMAILLLVGQGYERPDLVDALFDITANPCKPVYTMASEIPLVLWDCQFDDDVVWKSVYDSDAPTASLTASALKEHIYNVWYDGRIRTEMQHALRSVFETAIAGADDPAGKRGRTAAGRIMDGSGLGRWTANYVPVLDRKRMDPVDVVNARWLQSHPGRARPPPEDE